MNDVTVRVSIQLNASSARVWNALTDPALIKEYFLGTEVDTNWRPGSPIYFRGSWEGKAYEDKGVILESTREKRLAYTYWSSLSGVPDVAENYKPVTFDLSAAGAQTLLTLSQGSDDEKSKAHSENNWKTVPEGLKKVAERPEVT